MSKVLPRVALFLRYLGGGGAELAMLNLARSFSEQGFMVDLVLGEQWGPHLWKVPPQVRIVNLKAPRLLGCLLGLVRYLKREQPTALLSTLHYTNEIALWAKRLSGVSTRVVVREANNLAQRAQHSAWSKQRLTPFFVKHFYSWADGIVAISHGLAKDLAQITKLPLERIRVIYSPVVTPELAERAKEIVEHPWFNPGEPPVVLGVGKLEEQKDFPTLIRAFAQVRKQRPARLMILGWGPDRSQLEALVHELSLEDDVALLGYTNNPYAYMARSAVFVLSSAWEGFGNVIVEAMAVGTPVISTNCESGPAEILDNGKYGSLVPVGDSQALAESISHVLAGNSKSVDPAWLNQFTMEVSAQQYLDVLGLADTQTIMLLQCETANK